MTHSTRWVHIAIAGVLLLVGPTLTADDLAPARGADPSEEPGVQTTLRERPAPRRARAVSVLDLALNPRRYAGQRVAVVGILSAFTPDTGLYAFREAYDHLTNDHVGVTLPDELTGKSVALHGRWVEVTGTFRLWRSGDIGSIGNVTSIETALDREKILPPDKR